MGPVPVKGEVRNQGKFGEGLKLSDLIGCCHARESARGQRKSFGVGVLDRLGSVKGT